jgi:hypothetical protein
MKKLFTLFILLTCLHGKTQTLHKVWNLNYCNAGDCNMNTLTYGGSLYFCYVEDSLMFSGAQGLVLQKNDLNGNLIWKRTYRLNPTQPPTPVKILALGSNLYIGGTYLNSAFILKVDSTAGNINYFNTYPPFGSIAGIQIKDIAVLNNTEIVAVGNGLGNPSGVYMYVLRALASTGAVVTAGTNSLNDQRPVGVCCYNNSIYIVGANSSFPFLAKLRINGGGYTSVGTRMYNGGLTISSYWERIAASSGSLTILGAVNNSTFRNLFVKLDTNATSSSSPIIGRISPGTNVMFHNFVLNGNNAVVSGIYNNMYGVLTLDNNLNTLACNTYSTFGFMTQIQYHNNNTYFTISTGNTGSNVKLMKGDNFGVTVCSSTLNPGLTFQTMTSTVITTSLSSNTTYTVLSPITYTSPITPTTTCLSTGIRILDNETNTKLLSGIGQFEIVSEDSYINEISVFDLTGKLILNDPDLKQESYKVDLNSSAKGLYFIKVRLNNGQAKVFKVVNQ